MATPTTTSAGKPHNKNNLSPISTPIFNSLRRTNWENIIDPYPPEPHFVPPEKTPTPDSPSLAVQYDNFLNEFREMWKCKKKRKHLSREGQKANVVLDDVDGGKCSEVAKLKKGKVVENKGKGKVVETKGKGKVMTRDGENEKEDAVVLGNVNVPKEVKGRKDLSDSTSMYPELTRTLELKTLSGMPKKCVMDIISSMGRKKASELEEKWADFCLMEIQLNAKKLDLINNQIKVILEATRR